MSYPGTYSTSAPDRPAVIMARDGAVRTFAELEARSCQFAQLMWAAGLRPGDHVAIFADNNIGYFDAYWAAMRSGLYFTTVNRYLTAEEAAYIVNDCGGTGARGVSCGRRGGSRDAAPDRRLRRPAHARRGC